MTDESKYFEFTSYEIQDKKTIVFNYLITIDKDTYNFSEKIILPNPISSDISPAVLKNVLESLHLILGISYWKMYCPEKISYPYFLTQTQTDFWNLVYKKGLGEFFYKNGLDHRKYAHIFGKKIVQEKQLLPESNGDIKKEKTLIGIGGGKDSIVAAEKLKAMNKNLTGFILENKGEEIKIKENVLRVLNIPYLVIKREMDEKLLDQSTLPKAYNGHVPITAIYFFISLLVAVLEGFSAVVIPNGKSADSGNLEYLGEMINHQWSKSHEFEQLFQSYVTTLYISDMEIGSTLRQMTDFEIFKEFIKYPKYFDIFSSCNRNFSVLKKQETLWCGRCAKCAYTFLMLAAFLPKTEVIKIFGKNLLEDQELNSLFEDLLGLGKMKPFDCVGTADEVKQAMTLVIKKGEYKINFEL